MRLHTESSRLQERCRLMVRWPTDQALLLAWITNPRELEKVPSMHPEETRPGAQGV